MRLNALSLIVIVFLLIPTAGCASNPEVEPTQVLIQTNPTSTSAPAVAPTSEARASQNKLDGAIIVFWRSGGLAGTSDRWSIFADGRITHENGQEYEVQPSEVADLIAEIQASGFFSVEGPPRSLNICADCFTYSLAVDDGSQIHQITYTDADTNISEEVLDLIVRVQNFLGSLEAK